MDSIQKYILLIRGRENEDYEPFQERILNLADKWVNEQSVERVKICLTTEAPPAISIIPFRKDKVSILSLYTTGNFKPEVNHDECSGLYFVEEALPVSYDKDWPDKELTPGICLLTFFRKKKSISYEKFIDRWHNGHTPLSLKIHPLWHYSRNVVRDRLLENSEDFDGIVDEHFKRRKDLLNPFLFFGHPLIIVQRMLKVYFDVNSFLDYKTIESYLTREIHLK